MDEGEARIEEGSLVPLQFMNHRAIRAIGPMRKQSAFSITDKPPSPLKGSLTAVREVRDLAQRKAAAREVCNNGCQKKSTSLNVGEFVEMRPSSRDTSSPRRA